VNKRDPTGLCAANEELWALFYDNDGDGNPTNGRDPDGLKAKRRMSSVDPGYGTRQLDPACYSLNASLGVECVQAQLGVGSGLDPVFEAWWFCNQVVGLSPGSECDWHMWLEANDFEAGPLTDAEKKKLGPMCEKVDCDAQTVVRPRGVTTSATTGYALGENTVFLNGATDPAKLEDIALLAQELTHMLQIAQLGVWTFYKEAGTEWFWAILGRVSPYQLPVPLPPDRPFSSYGLEQQGVIVYLCYLGNRAACRVAGL